MFRFRSVDPRHRATASGFRRCVRWKPVLELLEGRCLLTCTTGPWCLDPAFGTSGHTDFAIENGA